MKRKTPAELEKAKAIKIARSLTRLKHSLKADEELNDLLPDLVENFDESLGQGVLPQLEATLSDVLDEPDE